VVGVGELLGLAVVVLVVLGGAGGLAFLAITALANVTED
jgi:hypothetical protein